MKHNTLTGQLGSKAPHTDPAATGTATSSLVDNPSSSSRSSYSRSDSYGTPSFRNKNLSPGARLCEHPLRPHPTDDNASTVLPGSHPHAHADAQTKLCTTPAGAIVGPPMVAPGPSIAHAPSTDAEHASPRDPSVSDPSELISGYGPWPPTPLPTAMPMVPHGPTRASGHTTRANHSYPAAPAGTPVERSGLPRPPPQRPRGTSP